MNFGTAIRTCFSNYAQFSGRASRPEFWWFFLFLTLMEIGLSAADAAIFGFDARTGETRSVLSGIFKFVVFIPLLAVSFRRLHDSGRPGWYVLLPMILTALTYVFIFSGVIGLALVQRAFGDPELLLGPASFLGAAGIIGLLIAQFVLFIVMIVWLIKPSDPHTNSYGPPPQP